MGGQSNGESKPQFPTVRQITRAGFALAYHGFGRCRSVRLLRKSHLKAIIFVFLSVTAWYSVAAEARQWIENLPPQQTPRSPPHAVSPAFAPACHRSHARSMQVNANLDRSFYSVATPSTSTGIRGISVNIYFPGLWHARPTAPATTFPCRNDPQPRATRSDGTPGGIRAG